MCGSGGDGDGDGSSSDNNNNNNNNNNILKLIKKTIKKERGFLIVIWTIRYSLQ